MTGLRLSIEIMSVRFILNRRSLWQRYRGRDLLLHHSDTPVGRYTCRSGSRPRYSLPGNTNQLKLKLHTLKHSSGITLGEKFCRWQMHIRRLVDLVGLLQGTTVVDNLTDLRAQIQEVVARVGRQ